MFRPKVVSVAALLALCLPSVCLTATIHVPADQPTIQAGIDAAIAGDTVLVADGIYKGDGNRDIDFGGKGIVLKSENGPETTIIDCEGSYLTPHRGFSFHSGEDSSAVVDGFTIQGGYDSNGGGVYCYDSNPTISNNTISDNTARSPSLPGGRGGGIYCEFSNPTINNNTISRNSAYFGGGIYCSDSSPNIINNTISGSSTILGGGIHLLNSSPRISNNTISGNSASGGGGGIYLRNSSPRISNNTISGNSSGGIYCDYSSPIITHTILWANSGNQVYASSSLYPVITYCDIQGDWEGEGNIDADPLFVGPYNGNVCSQSPCIDAGDPLMLDPDGSRSDIGRFFPEHPECTFGNTWYVSTTGSDTSGDGSPGNPFRTIQHGVDVSHSSDTVIVANGTYVENVTIWGKSILLASEYLFSGDTLDIHNTTIDGNSVSRVVTLLGCDSLSGLTGFTIQGGYGSDGGGIYCSNSNLTISDNCISGNSATRGGGLRCDYSDPTISNNSISGNSARNLGGGIYCSNSNPTISNNSISGNSASDGGGISCHESNPTISNNSITGNSAGAGGGIFYYSLSNPTVINNIISGNSALQGGGIYCYDSSPVMTNSILAFNRQGGGAIRCSGDSNPTLTCCDVYGNEGGDWVDCIADQAGMNGNFSADPLFCDTAAGDYHLSSNSPCAAENNSCGELIGALGVACHRFLCGDADGDDQVTLGDVELVRAFYFASGDWPTPMAAGDANCSGLVNIGDIIYLADYLFRDGDYPCCP